MVLYYLREAVKLVCKIPVVICLWIALLIVSVIHTLYKFVHLFYWLILVIGMVACIFDQYWYGAVGLLAIAVISAIILGMFDVVEAGIQGMMLAVMSV